MERMILASSDEEDLVVDPFSGSGTTLRVCQQLRRNAIGIEINPDYVAMIKSRLAEPFTGFDSVDPRMERVPLDLRHPEFRADYLAKHQKWFLSNHENALKRFKDSVATLYGRQEKQSRGQMDLFQDSEEDEPASNEDGPRRPTGGV